MCYFCRELLPCNHRKREKLHAYGEACLLIYMHCSIARSVLCQFICVPLGTFAETRDPGPSWHCYMLFVRE